MYKAARQPAQTRARDLTSWTIVAVVTDQDLFGDWESSNLKTETFLYPPSFTSTLLTAPFSSSLETLVGSPKLFTEAFVPGNVALAPSSLAVFHGKVFWKGHGQGGGHNQWQKADGKVTQKRRNTLIKWPRKSVLVRVGTVRIGRLPAQAGVWKAFYGPFDRNPPQIWRGEKKNVAFPH